MSSRTTGRTVGETFSSSAMRDRRYIELPISEVEESVYTDVQGRGWGTLATTSPAAMTELISSISSVGQLEPVLLEEIDGESGRFRLVSGERRLRAMKWGAAHDPENGNFSVLSAVVVRGPLDEETRRTWQLVENLARQQLQPGELGAALLYERSAVLLSKLIDHGVEVDHDGMVFDDPVAKFEALDRLRISSGLHSVGAPWREVIQRIGIDMSPATARNVAKAFRTIPQPVSSEMDDAAVALASRLAYGKLHQGRAAAAAGIWDLVKKLDCPRLLTRAVAEAFTDPEASPETAVDRAVAVHEAANQARSGSHSKNDGIVFEEVLAQFHDVSHQLLTALSLSPPLNEFQARSLLLLLSDLRQVLDQSDTESIEGAV